MSQLVLESSNVSTTLNSKLGLLRDDVDSEINQIDNWINSLINENEIESTKRTKRCEICNSKENYFEGHHIAGRKHDYRQITVCKPCHNELSLLQKTRDKRWLEFDQSQSLRESFFLHGMYDVLILKSKKTKNSHYEKLATLLIENISKGLKSR